MIYLIFEGQLLLFTLLILALIASLSFHEFGHALVAKLHGDDTAERAGRLTLNPVAHIDVFGLLMVVMVGFGYAKPVPTDPRNFRSRRADLWVGGGGARHEPVACARRVERLPAAPERGGRCSVHARQRDLCLPAGAG
ncbi:MAG: site-2 protease family protein [Gammaproteobacteria bacterium]|nr:site-2 protease family protein [Gammaproteobacteria bacterium]